MNKLFSFLLVVTLSACGGGGGSGSSATTANPQPTPSVAPQPQQTSFPSLIDLPVPQARGIETDDAVTITQSVVTIPNWMFALNSDNSLASVDFNVLDSTSFNTMVLENRYLRVELLPEFGGRIISIFNKSTNKEQLFRNPVNSPYLINTNIFYYNWLMVFGGIFPTFPEPEHGKSWLVPWETEIVNSGGEIASVQMSFTDDFEFAQAPNQFRYGTTNMICTYTVSLEAGRAAVDVLVTIENPTNVTQTFEYWTNTAFAPGNEDENTFLTDGYEMIADIENLAPPRSGFGSPYGIVDGEQRWDEIKFFSNHISDGIAYPSPNIAHSNFWGAINHDNEEGFFRVADNSVTPGLKIFAFGRDDTVGRDPRGTTTSNDNWKRPAVELWAGLSDQFFFPATMAAQSSLTFSETYAASVGMADVTHASDDVLINVENGQVNFAFFTPEQNYSVELVMRDNTSQTEVIVPDMVNGNTLMVNTDTLTSVVVTNSQDQVVMDVGIQ